LLKKIQQKYSQHHSVPLMIDFARRTLKDLKKYANCEINIMKSGAKCNGVLQGRGQGKV